MNNLTALLDLSARRYPERTAIVAGQRRYTYRELDQAACRTANLLSGRGVRPGDRVALMCPNVPEFTVAYFGILKAGAVVVPLNVMLQGREVAYHLADSGAKAFVAFEGTAELPTGTAARCGFDATPTCIEYFSIAGAAPDGEGIERADGLRALSAAQPSTFATVEVSDEATAVILYTSGTTGTPKGAELRHRNMRDNALVVADLFEADPDDPDTYLAALPLFHSFGQTVIQNAALARGGTIVMLPRFDATAALQLMRDERVTFFAGVPTMYWSLLRAAEAGEDLGAIAGRLRVAAAGGSALPAEIHRRFSERFGITIVEGYGLSETSPVASFSRLGVPPRVGSIGTPVDRVEMKLVDTEGEEISDDPAAVGEIAIRGHNVMKGYHGRPEATAEVLRDGWFRTGDLARRDRDGFYFIVDRSKDVVIRGGYNVYPRELEEVLITHPAISIVAVVGVPHEVYGEEVKAVVVTEPGVDATEAEIIAWSKQRLAAFKYPRIVEFREELPMTATGKILKREIT